MKTKKMQSVTLKNEAGQIVDTWVVDMDVDVKKVEQVVIEMFQEIYRIAGREATNFYFENSEIIKWA